MNRDTDWMNRDTDWMSKETDWMNRDTDWMNKETDWMNRETQLASQNCNGCYCTNSLLAIKIIIVLEMNIKSSSSDDREEGTGDFKTLSEFYQ